MSRIERVEYYNSCPSCGAAGEGALVCSYCGTSLIKQRFVMNSAMEVDDVIRQEDAALPVFKGKSCEVNSFLKLFCPLFGGIFLLVPTILFMAFLSAGIMELFIIPFLSIFWLIGIGGLAPLVIALKNRNKCDNGRLITAMVRGYENANYSINNTPVKILRLRIDDELGSRIVLLSTGETIEPYPVGSIIRLRNNGDFYKIEG